MAAPFEQPTTVSKRIRAEKKRRGDLFLHLPRVHLPSELLFFVRRTYSQEGQLRPCKDPSALEVLPTTLSCRRVSLQRQHSTKTWRCKTPEGPVDRKITATADRTAPVVRHRDEGHHDECGAVVSPIQWRNPRSAWKTNCESTALRTECANFVGLPPQWSFVVVLVHSGVCWENKPMINRTGNVHWNNWKLC